MTATQVSLSWSASTDTGGSGLAGYRVFRNGSMTPIATVGVTQLFGYQPYCGNSLYLRGTCFRWRRECLRTVRRRQRYDAYSARHYAAYHAGSAHRSSAGSRGSAPQLDGIDGCVGNSALRNSARRREDQRRSWQRDQLCRFHCERGDDVRLRDSRNRRRQQCLDFL